MLPACCVGLKRSWPEVAVTGDGWNVCKTFPPGERRSGAGPVEQGETEETARFLVFFLLVGFLRGLILRIQLHYQILLV